LKAALLLVVARSSVILARAAPSCDRQRMRTHDLARRRLLAGGVIVGGLPLAPAMLLEPGLARLKGAITRLRAQAAVRS